MVAKAIEVERNDDGEITHLVLLDEDGMSFLEGSPSGFVDANYVSEESMHPSEEHDTSEEDNEQWNCEIHQDGTLTLDPCPFCKREIFNVVLTHGGQVLRSPDGALDEQKGNYHVDDYYDFNLEMVKCQSCDQFLYEHGKPIEIPSDAYDPEEILTENQKSNLLDHAKRVASSSFDQLGWEVDSAVQGGIDDAADERFSAGFKGEREVAYDFLDERRDEIKQTVEEVKELPFTTDAPLTDRTIRIFRDENTPSGKNWEYVDE